MDQPSASFRRMLRKGMPLIFMEGDFRLFSSQAERLSSEVEHDETEFRETT
jgi:hypothetical protein